MNEVNEVLNGYEIHMGKTEFLDTTNHAFSITNQISNKVYQDGLISEDGLVLGTYMHGIFDNDLYRRSLLNALRLSLIHIYSFTTVIDATHPYAMNVSKTSLAICETLNIPYIRYERAKTALPSYDKMSIVTDYDEAVSLAAAIGKRIFLTIGSRNLKYFAKLLGNKEYFLVARVLPDETVLHECFSMGFMPNQLILMQGPFSQTLNRELYKKYQADVIIRCV